MPDLGAIILCGGKSIRMGTDKARLPFADEPMLTRIVRLVAEVVPQERIVCVTAEDQMLPDLPSVVRVVRDRVPGRGPLEGLAVGLGQMQQGVESVFVTPCDVPLLRPAFIRYMFDALGPHEMAVPHIDGRWFALSSVLRPSVLPKVDELLAQGERRVRALTTVCHTREVTAEELRTCDPELKSLWNCNGPAEYQTALGQYRADTSLS